MLSLEQNGRGGGVKAGRMPGVDETLSTGRLRVRQEAAGAIRIGTEGHPDWFGPGRARLPEGVRRDVEVDPDREGVVVVTLEATTSLDGIAGEGFDRPAVCSMVFDPAARLDGGLPSGATAMGHQFMEFALPTAADAGLLADWLRWPFRPAVVQPLWLSDPEGPVILLAPVDAPFEQVIAVPASAEQATDGVRVGWHGDLDSVPAGFSTRLAVVLADGPRAAIATWSDLVAERMGRAGERAPDVLSRSVSYWTDNGAAYWYRTEGGRSVTDTLVDTLADLRDRQVPYTAVQLDSWFYPHETVRPFDTDEWVVPPTGLMDWDARSDILPDGIPALRAALGNPPLATHCRHLSSASPLAERFDCWVDGATAHPTGPDYYALLLDRAQSWGVEVFEHDWLIECFLAVRGLRTEPGRAAAWQHGLDVELARRGMTAQWCMGSPADLQMASTLPSVTSVRTSGDHGYLVGPHALWAWFCATNVMARALGLSPFKDVFRTGPSTPAGEALVETVLSALSCGPIGIGDRLGETDARLVRMCGFSDGTIVRPDVPLAAVDRSMRAHPFLTPTPMIAATHVDHGVGRYAYVVSLDVTEPAQRLECDVALADLGEDAPSAASGVIRWDAVAAAWAGPVTETGWHLALDHQGMDLSVLVPAVDGLAVLGDPDLVATAGRRRCERIDPDGRGGVTVVLSGAPGEELRVAGWSSSATVAASVGGAPPAVLAVGEDGGWTLPVTLDETGATQIGLSRG